MTIAMEIMSLTMTLKFTISINLTMENNLYLDELRRKLKLNTTIYNKFIYTNQLVLTSVNMKKLISSLGRKPLMQKVYMITNKFPLPLM